MAVLHSKTGGVREGGWWSGIGRQCCETVGGNVVVLRVRREEKKKQKLTE